MDAKVKTGIDGMTLTFPTKFPLPDLLNMFAGVSSDMFTVAKPLPHYRDCLSLRSSLGTTLLQFHFNPTSHYGKRNCLQINGLCFAESALNPFRPLNLADLVTWATLYEGRTTGIDLYLDDFTAAISQERLNEMSQPHTFEQFIKSPFLRANQDGVRPHPRYCKGTWYYGQPQCNACEITTYNKGLSPRQKIHTKSNPLKFTWQRYELRLADGTAKRQGGKFLQDLYQGANMNTCITSLFREYLRFVDPNPKNSRLSSLKLQTWYSDLLTLADNQPPVILDCSVF